MHQDSLSVILRKQLLKILPFSAPHESRFLQSPLLKVYAYFALEFVYFQLEFVYFQVTCSGLDCPHAIPSFFGSSDSSVKSSLLFFYLISPFYVFIQLPLRVTRPFIGCTVYRVFLCSSYQFLPPSFHIYVSRRAASQPYLQQFHQVPFPGPLTHVSTLSLIISCIFTFTVKYSTTISPSF